MTKKTFNIYQYLQTEAIGGTLTNSDINFYRKVCRWYSKTFHTPLHIVMDGKTIQWDEILTHYYEEQMEEIPYNAVYEIACKDYIPELAEEMEAEDAAYAESLVEEQRKTLEAKKKREKKKQLKQPKKEEKQEDEQIDQPKEKPPEMKLNFGDIE